MKLKDKEAWAKFVEVNDDPYGGAVVEYSKQWAELMEKKMSQGEKLEDIAQQASHEADASGITGFMFGCAVSTLSQCWEFGEELRLWHNLETQISSEGEKANEEGGVLSPALLNLGTAEHDITE